MRRPPELLQIAALGLIQGATELLPVSSTAHVAALPRLLRWEVAEWDAARRKELEVALHAGAAVALAPEFLRLAPDVGTLARSLAPPVVVALLFERAIEELDPIAGLLLGAAALAAADRAGERTPGDPGWWLGLGASRGARARRLAQRRDAGRRARSRVLAGGGVAVVLRGGGAGARGGDDVEGVAGAARGWTHDSWSARSLRSWALARRCASRVSSGASRGGRIRWNESCWRVR